MNFPFEEKIENGKILRKFYPDVEDEELKWHQDEKDRIVTVLESGNWQFQIEDNLPNKLQKNDLFRIPKFVWHRVIKGDSTLVVEIEELDF